MERVDTLLVGATVVTMNQAFDLFRDGAIAIKGSQIVAVGPRDEVTAAYEADEVLDCTGKIIMPGLVNAHTHVPMTLLRGLADDLRLDVWLMGYCMPTEREFVSPEFCRLGTSLACAEMIRSGITAFADMYYYEADIAAATAEAGMRGVLGQSVLKFPAPDAATYENSLEYTRKFIEDWRDHPLITPAVAPHAPYSNTNETLQRCAELALEYDVPLLTHIAETKLEVENSIAEFGARVIPRVKETRLLEPKILAAHCVHIDSGEINMMCDHGVTVAHCPTSNLKLASGIAPVSEMLDAGLTVGIGTDGPASNNDLDMFEEMRLAAILAKAASNDPTVLPARQALLMATRQGAEALFMGDVTGSLEVGKSADLVIMNASPVHNTPHFERDPDAVYSRIVYAGKSTDVQHVMCYGRWLMRDQVLLTVDEASLMQEAAVYAQKVDAFLAAREQDVLSKLLAIGGIEQSESFEVQAKAVLPEGADPQTLLSRDDVQMLKHRRYRQYDTYFMFDTPDQGRLRYREDDSIDARGDVSNVRARLTYTVPLSSQPDYDSAILSQARFMAEADRPLRFYREYFQPIEQRETHKERERWHIHYQDILFYVNIDRVTQPALEGRFIEIKARTWSKSDAELKAKRIQEMLALLGIQPADIVREDYLELQTS